MKEIALPAEESRRIGRAKRLQRGNAALGILSFVFAVLAVLAMVGLLVCVIVYEFKRVAALPYCIIGLGAGALLFGFCGFGFAMWLSRREKATDDYLERMDSPESFFVGDGTLATFAEEGLRIHSEKRTVEIPYSSLCVYSVCTRKAPREKGVWNLVLEIPSSYISKEESGTALVQTDDKPRLRRVLEARGIEVHGEAPSAEKHKFTKKRGFRIPDAKKKSRAFGTLGFAALLIVAGVLSGVFWNLTAGGIFGGFGLFFGVRGAYALSQAAAVFALYNEGVYWKESRTERFFLKWEEITKVVREEKNGYRLLLIQCDYGAYRIPEAEGAFEEIGEMYPEKV